MSSGHRLGKMVSAGQFLALNPTMNGELETMVDEIMDARKTVNICLASASPEATYDNPMIYDLIFDLAWADEDFGLDQWISDYLIKCSGQSDNAEQAWG